MPVSMKLGPPASVGYGWKRMKMLLTKRMESLGHELMPFESHEYTRWGTGWVGYRFKTVVCRRCSMVCKITFCRTHGKFTAHGDELLRLQCDPLDKFSRQLALKAAV